MKVDVARIFAEETLLSWPLAEEILLVTVVFEPWAIGMFDDVETADFFSFPNQSLWQVIRTIHASQRGITVAAIFDEIERIDREQGKQLFDLVAVPFRQMLERHLDDAKRGDFSWAGVGASALLRKLRARRERLASW